MLEAPSAESNHQPIHFSSSRKMLADMMIGLPLSLLSPLQHPKSSILLQSSGAEFGRAHGAAEGRRGRGSPSCATGFPLCLWESTIGYHPTVFLARVSEILSQEVLGTEHETFCMQSVCSSAEFWPHGSCSGCESPFPLLAVGLNIKYNLLSLLVSISH